MTKNQKLPASKKKSLPRPKKALPTSNGKAHFTPTVVDETQKENTTVIVGGVQPPAKPPADFEPVEIDETAEWEGLCIGIVGGVQPPKKPSQ
jgi:hypothetical protein